MSQKTSQLVVGCLATAAVTLIVSYFHSRFWWPPDDGAYAYIAQRMLRGDTLSGDVQDIHAGYVHFIHALMMWLFGEDIVNLRYPLALLTVAQSAVTYALLLPKSRLVAFAGATAAGALTFVQFLNPSANWYVLASAIAVIAVLTWRKPEARLRGFLIGLLLMLAVLLRQLSGIFLAIGAVSWLLVEQQQPDGRSSILAKAILLVFAVGLGLYFLSKGSFFAFLLFGIWPIALIALIWRRVNISDRSVVALVVELLFGGLVAVVPLLAYHLVHGTLQQWFADVVVVPLQLNSLPFVAQASYATFLTRVITLIGASPGLVGTISAIYWLTLLYLPMAVGALFVLRVLATARTDAWTPLSLIAIFFAPVSAHYQIPIYLMYSSFLSLAGALSLARSGREAHAVAMVTLALSVAGLVLHAGQPLSRGLDGTILGERVALDAPEGLPRASIAMEARDVATYEDILNIIENSSAPSGRILALPLRPEFYFLSGRQSSFRFMALPFGIRNDAELDSALAVLAASPPKVVIDVRADKYHTPLSFRLLAEVRKSYDLIKSIGEFDVYVERK